MRAVPSRGEIESLLVNLVTEVTTIPRNQIVSGATLDNELRMESVAFVEIQVAIEDAYEIELDLIHIVELNEFSAIVDYVFERTSATLRK